jgi:hypothetical protein
MRIDQHYSQVWLAAIADIGIELRRVEPHCRKSANVASNSAQAKTSLA